MAAFAVESLAVAGTAVGFTVATYGSANKAFVTVEGGPVRFWVDGSTPTATAGHELEVGDVLELNNPSEIEKAKFIRRDSTSATLRCSFIK